MPKIQESRKKGAKTGNLWIIIPSEIAKLKGWKKGTILEFKEAHNLSQSEMANALAVVEGSIK